MKKHDTIEAWGKSLRNALLSDFPEDNFVKFCLNLEAEVYNRALCDLAKTIKQSGGKKDIEELVRDMYLTLHADEEAQANQSHYYQSNVVPFHRPLNS